MEFIRKISYPIISLFLIIFLFQNCSEFHSSGVTHQLNNSLSLPPLTGAKAILDCRQPKEIEPTVLSRMTKKEIQHSLFDLIGFNSIEDLKLLPADTSNDKGLHNDSSQQILFPDDGQKLLDFFNKAIEDAITRLDNKVINCDISNIDCIHSIIDQKSFLAHRGQPNPVTITKIKDNIRSFSTPEDQLKWALVSIFLAPEFLFHLSTAQNITTKKLNNYKIAGRLAKLLWNSIPDQELLVAAENGELSNERNLNFQIERMIDSEKIERFTFNFAEQWLGLDIAKIHFSETNNISNSLADSLINESRLLLNHIVKNNLPINELLSADYTFLNKEIADYYNLSSDNLTTEFTKVSTSNHRQGIFSQAAVITAMSEPGETNPTARGYWFLKRAFCLPPDPIPSLLMSSVDSTKMDNTLPMKERLSHLSKSRACSKCHLQMDPVGIAFENFDSYGRHRQKNGPHTVDTSGQLITGTNFTDSIDMTAALQNSSIYNFESCFSHHLISLSRSKMAKKIDLCSTNNLITKNDMTFKEIIKAIVNSNLFLK